ncbi:MAG: hypothetical protein ACFFFG_11975 [Candidatus Thorarchaeota archaeon]
MTGHAPDFTAAENDVIRRYYPWLNRDSVKTRLSGHPWSDIQRQALALGVPRDPHLSRIRLTENEFQTVLHRFTHRGGVLIELSRILKRPTKDLRRFIEVLIEQKQLPPDTGTPKERRQRKFTYLWQLLDEILVFLPPRFERAQITTYLEEVIEQLKTNGWFQHRAASHTIAYALVCYVCHQVASPDDPKFIVPAPKRNAVDKIRCLIGKQIEPVTQAKSQSVADSASILG